MARDRDDGAARRAALGYARIKHWRTHAEDGLACCEVAVWLGSDGLVVVEYVRLR